MVRAHSRFTRGLGLFKGPLSNKHIRIQSDWRGYWNIFFRPIGRYVSRCIYVYSILYIYTFSLVFRFAPLPRTKQKSIILLMPFAHSNIFYIQHYLCYVICACLPACACVCLLILCICICVSVCKRFSFT